MKTKLAAIAVVALALIGVVFAQDANVIILSDSDAQAAKVLWEKKQAADSAWESFSKKTQQKYVESVSHQLIQDGWQYGIAFSKDFKAIIPKQGVTFSGSSSQWVYPGCWNGTISPAPAFQLNSIN